MGAKVSLVAKSKRPVKTDTGYEIIPNLTFEECPEASDLLVVPGGTSGTLAAMRDRTTLDFIRKTGGAAAMAGSVCTGSLLLGAAGLLNGYEATSHWQTLDLLPLFGARPSDKRVVFDRNRVTGAGVTAGLDFALELVSRYRGEAYARATQLLAQYDPQPLFPKSGNPKTAAPETVATVQGMLHSFVANATGALREVYPRPGE